MNKNVLIGIVLIALAGAGYYQFSYKPAQEAAATAAADAKAAEEAAAKAAEEAAAATKKAADDAAAAAAATAPAATETAPAATETAPAATAPAATDAAAVLDPANFDAAKVNALIEASSLDAALKTTLKAGVDAAAADPTKVAEALAAVKTALGL